MKRIIHVAVASMLICGATIAAVPVRWTAETSRVQPIALDAWRGDTLALACTLTSYGKPVALGAATASLMWQTNGMGSAWWQTNATVSADGVITATWSPSMDPGAPAVQFFLPVQTGDGASYRAAGTLRFRPSPGAGSQIAELPQPGDTLDFGAFQLVNAPWATLEAANEAISAAVTSATGALVIPPPVDLGPYATTGYVAGAITSATGALVIPPPADLTPYATTGAVALAVQASSNALAGMIQAVSNAAMPRAEMGAYATQADVSTAIAGIQIPSLASYATQSYVADYFATNYTPPDLSSYASRSYADAAASNAQAAAIAAIPSLAGYATQSFVADYFATNYTPPDLSSYASRSYADAAASNAQSAAIAAIPSLAGYATQSFVYDYFATNYTPPDLSGYATTAYADAAASNAQSAAIAAIPSLAGYATETYAQTAAASAASDVLAAAKDFARDLSWATSEGNTRLVTLDGTSWQDATGTIWQVSAVYGWAGTVIDLPTTTTRAIRFDPVPDSPNTWTAGGGTNLMWDSMSWILEITNSLTYADIGPTLSATNLTFETAFDKYYLFYQPVSLVTNPVDRVVYESDIEALTGLDSKQDVLPYPTNAIPYSAISGAPDFSGYATAATNYTDAAIATLSQTNPVLTGGPYLQTSSNDLDHTVRVQYGTGPGGFTFSPSEIYVPGDAFFGSFLIASDDNRGPLSGIGQYGGAFSSARSEMEDYVTSSLSGYATHAQVLAAAAAATNYTDGAISTNNAAFVSAVLAVPLTGADAGDLAEIAEYGGYGTVGAAILALIAGIAALKRRVGTAETVLAGKMPMYPMVALTPSNGTLTVTPYTVATYTAGTTAAAFTVAVGAGAAGTARDCELVIDCTATGAVAPTVTWPSNFHPRTDAATDFACEAGVRNVYFISEFSSGEFAVGGWQETAGGNA